MMMKVYILMRYFDYTVPAELVDLYFFPSEALRVAKEKNKRSRKYQYFVRTKIVKGPE